MTTNVLKAIINISKSTDLTLSNYKKFKDEKNRIQEQGAGLEIFIKDSFCGIPTGSISNEKRIKNYLKEFSDTGQKNNPPDAMIKRGDAMEIKKHEGAGTANIALNTSPPRTILTDKDKNIAKETQNCEKKPWKRDYLYIIGNQKSGRLEKLTLCYGDCFVSSNDPYRKIFDKIKKIILKGDIGKAEFNPSKEFGRISKIDPQDFTKLRIRSMFELENPSKIFSNEINWKKNEKLVISLIMRKRKFLSFPKKDRDSLESFQIENFKGKNPDSPQTEMDLVLIRYSR